MRLSNKFTKSMDIVSEAQSRFFMTEATSYQRKTNPLDSTRKTNPLEATSYLSRRTTQKERVRILYRRALKDTLNCAVHRHLFYPDADALREKFEANRQVEDIELIDRMIAAGEVTHNIWRHPDPYIVLWAPGGSKFCRNPTPPSGIEIIYDYGRKDNN